MKKTLLYFLLCTFATIFSACSNDDDDPVILTGINDLSTQKLAIESGSSSTFEFSITPENATFNYDLTNSLCQISLKSLTTSSPNYRLSKVEPIAGINGRYRATVTDLKKAVNYTDQFVIYISTASSTPIKSDPIDIVFSGTSLSSLSFTVENNPGAVLKDITVDINDHDIKITSPFISSPRLVASFESNADRVLVNGIEQESSVTVNDFSSPVTYKVVSAQGKSEEYKVTIFYSGLPVVVIDTPNASTIPSKHENWLEKTSITILNPDGTVDYSGTTSIRGRGNSTWSYPKKPYNLKLDSKAKILGMPKHKRWVLLANWMDRTLLRNCVAFQIAHSTEMAWNPHGQFVDVVLNGKHIGNYFLCEQIKVDKNRVDIHELTDTDVDGGYIMELDTYFDETYKFRSDIRQLPYMFKDPDEVNNAQFNYMRNFIYDLESSLYDSELLAADKFMDYIDINSFIDWWFVHELTKNAEPKHPKSTYMHKDKGGKLCAGPVWDFDWETFVPGTGYTIQNTLYYPQLFQNATFVARVKERWQQLKPEFNKISAFIDSEAERIANSESINHSLWPITTSNVNGDESMSYSDAVKRMKSAYEEKLNWLDKAIRNM